MDDRKTERKPHGTARRTLGALSTLLVCAFVVAAARAATSVGAVASRPTGSEVSPSQSAAVELVRIAADSLVARRQAMPSGGWAWRSAIQAPHYQTDRDVGAASVGEGFLAAFAVTGDARYLQAAEQAGAFLIGVAEPAAGGLRWPDWADPDGSRSTTHFTSFDDGAAGISDFLLQLYQVDRQARFRTAALGGMRWLVAQAEGPSCPHTECSWRWTDDPSWRVAYNGVGMGQAGIVLALDTFADATGDATFRAYARAGADHLRLLTNDGNRPLPQGSEHPGRFETGFLGGSAGAAFMFLERYARDRGKSDLATATRLLRWVNGQAVSDGRGGLSWPVASDDPAPASGFQLGAAGIAWVNLQAAQITGSGEFRDVARAAGVWLRNVALAQGGWNELPGEPGSPIHVGLDSGAAGIGWVLADLAQAGVDRTANRAAADAALAWLRAGVARDALGAFWYENDGGADSRLPAEPSWHWGSAGIAAFGARLAGWSGRGPDGQRTG